MRASLKAARGASLRAVVITHGFYPRIGGAERMVASLSPLLQKRGVEVHILTRRLPGTPATQLFDGVPVHRLPVPGPKPLASLSFTLSALPLIARLRPDLIHAHELISPTTTALLAKALLRCPVIATVHRSGPPGDVMRMGSRPLGRLRMRWLCRHIDRFVVISREIDAELAGEGVPPHKRLVLPNGVDVRQFAPVEPEEKRALRQCLGLPPEAKLAVFAGRLAPEKRLACLVEIWPAVQACFPEACLLVLGSGPEEAALKELSLKSGASQGSPGLGSTRPGIRWLGAQDQVAPYLQASDLFVLPSSAEGLSVALLEAMACGLAPVVTAVGGSPDVIADRHNGRLVPPGDADALQDAILALFRDEAGRVEMGSRARQCILERYSLDSVAGRLFSLYQEIAQAGGRP